MSESRAEEYSRKARECRSQAGATADYLYYWHAREQIAEIKKAVGMNHNAQQAALKEAGGVQPYVIWVGVVFYLLFSLTMFKMLQEGTLDVDKVPKKPAKTAGHTEDVSAAAAT